jgi:putative methyltransferase
VASRIAASDFSADEPAGIFRPRILISEPHAAGEIVLPYLWAILKSYWEHHGSDPKAFTWMDPIYLRESVERNFGESLTEPPDVLGLSCYTWNWELQCKVARWAKERNPNCLVVAGGPDPDYKDPEFFSKHSYIDIIVVKDGEIPFTKILETLLLGGRDFRSIPGLYLPASGPALGIFGDSAPVHLYTGPTEVPAVFDFSPYIEQSELYERIMAQLGNRWINATWETNRGCPYSCSFCDWGSATMSKVRRFDMGRVEAEVDWLGKIGVSYIFLADANFGILPRDVDIADRLAEVRAKYNFPRGIYYCSAKNNPDRMVEIARRTYDAKLTAQHVLSVQHTDSEVLAATDRSNIPASKYREVVAKLSALGIACDVQLILGIPGDSVEKWKNCLAEIMDWGIHDNFQISPYALLPNAPAAEPKFKQKWEIDTVERGLIPYGGIRINGDQGYTKSRIIVGWRGFTREDWVEVSTYSAFVRAFHNRSLTRFPAMYLRFVHGVPYRDIYGAIIDEFCRNSPSMAPLYRRVRTLFTEFLVNPDMTDEMALDDFEEAPFVVDASKWLYVKSCFQLDGFYRELSRFLTARFPQAPCLKGAIEYQRNMVITPDYSSRKGKSFPVQHDWPAFFETARGLLEYRQLDEPTGFRLPRIAEIPEEERPGRGGILNFGEGSMEERRSRWLIQTVNRQNWALFSNYPQPRITSGVKVPGLDRVFSWI